MRRNHSSAATIGKAPDDVKIFGTIVRDFSHGEYRRGFAEQRSANEGMTYDGDRRRENY